MSGFRCGFSSVVAILVALVSCLALETTFAQKKNTASVSLDSQPTGASVSVDGKDLGLTPAVIPDLTAGRHLLRFRLQGYVDCDQQLDVAAGAVVERSVVLKEEKGLLLLRTVPEGCDVQVDGHPEGVTPRLLTDLSCKDEHAVVLKKDGFQPKTLTVRLSGRRPVVREERLLPEPVEIDVTSEPAGAEVSVNDVVRGKAPVSVKVPWRGMAAVVLTLPGYQKEVRMLSVAPGDRTELKVKMTPSSESADSVQAARLEIRTEPAGAMVSLDGHELGLTPTRKDHATVSGVFVMTNLQEGAHELVLRKHGYEDVSRRLTVQRTKPLQLSFRLRRAFVPDVEVLTDNGTFRGVLKGTTEGAVEVEVRPGISQRFPRDQIREMRFIKRQK